MKLTLAFLSLILASCQPLTSVINPEGRDYKKLIVGKWATTQKIQGYKDWDIHLEFRADGTKIGNWTIYDAKENPHPHSYKANWSINKATLKTTIFEAAPELLEREQITLPYKEKSYIRSLYAEKAYIRLLTEDELVITFTPEGLALHPREWLIYKRED